MSEVKELSEVFSKPFVQRVEAYLKQHQKALLVCVVVVVVIFVLIQLSSNNSNHSIEAFNHSPVVKEKAANPA